MQATKASSKIVARTFGSDWPVAGSLAGPGMNEWPIPGGLMRRRWVVVAFSAPDGGRVRDPIWWEGAKMGRLAGKAREVRPRKGRDLAYSELTMLFSGRVYVERHAAEGNLLQLFAWCNICIDYATVVPSHLYSGLGLVYFVWRVVDLSDPAPLQPMTPQPTAVWAPVANL